MSDISVEIEKFMRGNARSVSRGLLVAGNLAASVKEVVFTVPNHVWHTVGATGEPAFLNSWANFDATTWEAAAFRIDDEGIVYAKGLVTGGTPGATSVVWTMPAGYRVALNRGYPTDSNNAHGRITVKSNGDVIAEVGNTAHFFVDVIRYEAAGPCATPKPWTTGGFPRVIDAGLKQAPAGVVCWSCLDITSAANTSAPIFSTAPMPRIDWEASTDGKVHIKRFVGLSPGRTYRAQLVFFAG